MDVVVKYDRDRLRDWLGSETSIGETEAEAMGVDCSDGVSAEMLTALDDMLSNNPAGWELRADVTSVGIWPVSDGAVITLDLEGFPRVASMHQDAKWLSRRAGVDAALDTLARVAEVLNELGVQVGRVRR